MISQKKEAVFIKILVYSGTILTLAILVSVVGYILFKGIPNLSLKLFEWRYTTENVSLLPALINTLLMTFLSLLFAAPLGIFAAVYRKL
jgi:phosphate transport system permease protein